MSNKTLPENHNLNQEQNYELYRQLEALKQYASELAEENKRLNELLKTDFNGEVLDYENPSFTKKDIAELVKERDSYKKLALAKIKDMILGKIKEEYPDTKCTSIDELPTEFHRLVCARISPATAYKIILERKERGATKPASMGSINSESEESKEFYTSAEADKLTQKQLSNPKVMNAVLKSMLKW